MRGPTAEGKLDVLGPAEGAVDRVIGVDADTTVEVLGGMNHPMGTLGSPARSGGQARTATFLKHPTGSSKRWSIGMRMTSTHCHEAFAGYPFVALVVQR